MCSDASAATAPVSGHEIGGFVGEHSLVRGRLAPLARGPAPITRSLRAPRPIPAAGLGCSWQSASSATSAPLRPAHQHVIDHAGESARRGPARRVAVECRSCGYFVPTIARPGPLRPVIPACRDGPVRERRRGCGPSTVAVSSSDFLPTDAAGWLRAGRAAAMPARPARLATPRRGPPRCWARSRRRRANRGATTGGYRGARRRPGVRQSPPRLARSCCLMASSRRLSAIRPSQSPNVASSRCSKRVTSRNACKNVSCKMSSTACVACSRAGNFAPMRRAKRIVMRQQQPLQSHSIARHGRRDQRRSGA